MGFNRGDFFHVIGKENDPEWYEACNPATGARGLVPVAWFQVLGKIERDSADSSKSIGSLERTVTDTDSGYSDRSTNDKGARKSVHEKAGGPLYGIVQYDFNAERPDELEAKAGEAVIVIAQSNKEWFVAKPIGRLGGPGLIPVGFIEIRDMTTGQPCEDKNAAIARAGVPKVEEWKRRIAEYKNSSITLGKFNDSSDPNQPAHQDVGFVSGFYWFRTLFFRADISRIGQPGVNTSPFQNELTEYRELPTGTYSGLRRRLQFRRRTILVSCQLHNG